MENSLSPRGELDVFFFSYKVLVAMFLSFSGLRNVFVVLYSGLLPLDQSLLVVPTLRSDFIDSRKFVFCCCRLRALPCCDLHSSTSLLSPLLFYYVEPNTKMPESLRDYWSVLNAFFQ